jgi:NADPH-dependent 7-cyano-7-deazaguanine reductase QueF
VNLPNLVGTDFQGTVALNAPIRHLCPFKDEVDSGTITITWTCAGFTIELHSLASYLAQFSDSAISHEDLVEFIALDMDALGNGIAATSVTARFTTAGLGVEVSRGAVPVHAVGT